MEARWIHQCYTLASEAFGGEISIDVHCHCELDVPSAIKVAQAVDILQPDIINSGGITGVKTIADMAARYRIPIALHNVSGLMLNMASQQVTAAVFNCPRIESNGRRRTRS